MMGNKAIYGKIHGAVISIHTNLSVIWVLIASRLVLKTGSCVNGMSLTNRIHGLCSHVYAILSYVEAYEPQYFLAKLPLLL